LEPALVEKTLSIASRVIITGKLPARIGQLKTVNAWLENIGDGSIRVVSGKVGNWAGNTHRIQQVAAED